METTKRMMKEKYPVQFLFAINLTIILLITALSGKETIITIKSKNEKK